MRRLNGEGTYGKRTIKGVEYRYFSKYYDGVRKTFYGKTVAEVNEKKEKFEKSLNKLTPSVKQTFGEYAKQYLNSLTLTDNGYDGYEVILRVRVEELAPYLYNSYLVKVDRSMAKRYFQSLQDKYAKKTITKTVVFLKQILNQAVKDKLIEQNPFDEINLKKIPEVKKTNVFFSKDELNLFYQGCLHKESLKERWNHHAKLGEFSYGIRGLALAFISQTGIRVGECMGLRWEDIDFNEKIVHICRSANLVKVKKNGDLVKKNDVYLKKVVEKSTKTIAGDRFIPLNDKALYILSLIESEGLVFSNNGKYLRKDSLRQTCMGICKRQNIPVLSTHGLRHSFGSVILHEENIDIQVVSKLLGHADISTTYNIYTDVLNSILAKSVSVLN